MIATRLQSRLLVFALAWLPLVGWAATFTVTNTDDAGAGSLRQAIIDANNDTGVPHLIEFDIPDTDPNFDFSGNGEYRIQLATPLPALLREVEINGQTHPDFTGRPIIDLRGPGVVGDGLVVNAAGAAIRGLIISEFDGDGIEVAADNVVIQGNWIGLDAAGAGAAGNTNGVRVFNAASATIGGTGLNEANVISGNTSDGVVVDNSTGATVQGNYIGLNPAGTGAIANGDDGLDLINGASANTVGGSGAGAGNVISGNTNVGIALRGSDNNVLLGNYVGTNAAGDTAIGNGGAGVLLINTGTDFNTIGASGAGNVISGNGTGGLLLDNASNNTIQGNFIGTDATGSLDLGNGGDGIRLSNTSQDNRVGGVPSDQRNAIAFNGAAGIYAMTDGAVGNAFIANSIFNNTDLGIDLDPTGVATNDPDDGDAGPNNAQNYPVITEAIWNGTNLELSTTLDSTPNTYFRLHFYVNSPADPSGYGEGERYIGSVIWDTDGNGDISLGTGFPVTVDSDDFITGLATVCRDGSACANPGDTSEFSLAAGVSDESAVSNLVSEISPNNIAVSSTANAFDYDILPRIDPDNSGLNEYTITAPAGYSNLSVSAVNVGGTPLASGCNTPATGEYCAVVSGDTITVTLGDKVTADATTIRTAFTADPPASAGSGDFTAAARDTDSSIAPHPATAGDADGDGADANSQTVTVEGAAVSSVVAEISPNNVPVSSTGNNFVYDLLPTIGGGDTGINEIAITAPSGYGNLTVTGVNVGGADQTLDCGALGAGQYCAMISGQVITVELGSRVTADATPIQIRFDADAPGTGGAADFTSTVDDNTTVTAAQSTTVGDADGDASDADSQTVTVEGDAVSGAAAEISPNAVAVDSTGNTFVYDILPTINADDTGLNEITITAPAGYSGLAATNVNVGGTDQTLDCGALGAGEYCATTSGQVITVELGSAVTADATPIQIGFDADAPGGSGAADFTSTVDDSTTVTAAQSTAAGNADGDASDADSQTVTVEGAAVSAAVAEISPNAVAVSSTGNGFVYDILPAINAGDTGINEIAVTAPAGYSGLAVTNVNVGGTDQTLDCAGLGAGEYCATISGQVITVELGAAVTVDATPIKISFDADAPGTGSAADFTSMVDDNTTVTAAQSTTAGDADGDNGDDNSQTVTVEGAAVSTVVAEISPGAVATNSTGNTFVYDILPAINAGDTGLNEIAITAPAGYSSLVVSNVNVGGSDQTLDCAGLAAGEYCATISGQVITVELGSTVTVDATPIQISFDADAPGTAGTADFSSTVDDNTTVTAAQSTTAGNADGDPGDADSRNVDVQGAAVSSVVAEIAPNAVAAGSTANSFTYTWLPAINAGDTGVDAVTVTLPSGYGNAAVNSFSVGGTNQSSNCPSPGPGEYCASISGQTITFALGAAVTVSQVPLQAVFNVDAPATSGASEFTSSVDDTRTVTAPQNTTAGNADGNDSDADSRAVTIQGLPASSVLAETTPTTVPAGTSGQVFDYFLLPTISSGDSGINQIQLTVPAGYNNLSTDAVSVGGVPLTSDCPAPGGGSYCSSSNGQTLSVLLGDKLTTNATGIRLRISADTPTAEGVADLTAAVFDTDTVAGDRTAVAGNADGDGANANSISVTVTPSVRRTDAVLSTLQAEPERVEIDGTTVSTITVTLRDADNQPIPDRTVQLVSDRGAVDTIVQPAGPTDANGIATGTIISDTPGIATISATDSTDDIALEQTVDILFTQGEVLRLTKTANKPEAVVGDIVTYRVAIQNTASTAVQQVNLLDRLPPNFKYIADSARLDGQPLEPAGGRTLDFSIGEVQPLDDANGNGVADPGETGYRELVYQTVIGSGAAPGEYTNRARAVDVCADCPVSNLTQVSLDVTVDPVFDLGTLIGKVFEDKDGDGVQSGDEQGVEGAMVALDNGTYALTDRHGRYHFPAVKPGHRLLKINLNSLPGAAGVSTTGETRVVSVTPGLLAKANFGIQYQVDTRHIGRKGRYGVRMNSRVQPAPVHITGNTESLMILINGELADFTTREIEFSARSFGNVIEVSGRELSKPLRFSVEVVDPESVQGWRLTIHDNEGDAVNELSGDGAPPQELRWDGRGAGGNLVRPGEVYQYQLHVGYRDGVTVTGPRHLLAVNRTDAIELTLAAGAFEEDTSNLTDRAKTILKRSAALLRRHPTEKVIIEGHTADAGDATDDQTLSERRAAAVRDYLVDRENLPAAQFIVNAFGASQPLASNATPEGRRLNERVEIRGEISRDNTLEVYRGYRRDEPIVNVDGEGVPVNDIGRFSTQVDVSDDQESLDFYMENTVGQSFAAALTMPALDIRQPVGELALDFGAETDRYRVASREATRRADEQTLVEYRLKGTTDPDNTVEVKGRPVEVAGDGSFEVPLNLKRGTNVVGAIARNPQGYTRIVNLKIQVDDGRDGQLLMTTRPIPDLTLRLPREGFPLSKTRLVVPGKTNPENRVTINNRPVELNSDGSFAVEIDLPPGESQLLAEVTDPEGNTGAIEHRLLRSDDDLFLLAFADTKFSRLETEGNLENAGRGAAGETINQGRVAYYLKGTIAGKYLITSAYDSGQGEVDQLFKDLDRGETERLLRNLDPDTFYPVYGDDSTVVYDAQSKGKFYLAVESRQLNAVIGNYPLNFTETELASYQRTLYGAHVSWQSQAEVTKDTADGGRGQITIPVTRIESFVADTGQMPVRDELEATGGSLYYLSQRNVIEGSEQVTVLVRDKDTGLLLSRSLQTRNVDYTIHYDDGRILFNRPIQSRRASGSLVQSDLLGGHPVAIQIDYEVEQPEFEPNTGGARITQQVGSDLSLGASYINDDQLTEQYRLGAVDAEWQRGGYRVTAEAADSRGNDATTYVSDDGGFSYNQQTSAPDQAGDAYKLGLEYTGDQLELGAYTKQLDSGFVSNGNLLEQGSDKYGVQAAYQLNDQHRLLGRYDRDRRTQIGRSTELMRLQWQYAWVDDWELATEYRQRRVTDLAGTDNDAPEQGDFAAQVRKQWSEKLATRFGVQQTLDGTDNHQVRAGAEYRILSNLNLEGTVADGSRGRASEIGLSTQLAGSRVYLTERRQTDIDNTRQERMVLGTDTQLSGNTRLYTEYQWLDEAGTRGGANLVGLQRRWDVSDSHVTILFSGEYTDVDESLSNEDRHALALSVVYDDQEGIKLSSRSEVREQGRRLDQSLSINKAQIKIDPDYTLLGEHRVGDTRNNMNDRAEFRKTSLGLAYRPVDDDRINALFRYTRLLDEPSFYQAAAAPSPGSSAPANETRDADVLSTEWSYQINRRWEWVGKFALKSQRETVPGLPAVDSETRLAIQRANVEFRENYFLGVEYRVLEQKLADDRRSGFLTELMWEPVEHLRVGGGYNFTDFTDNEFSDNDYSVRGWFIRLQGTY